MNEQSNAARENLGEAAMFTPMYGILFCIRSVIGNEDPGLEVIEELFKKCLEIADIIAPILNSDSPEGKVILIRYCTKIFLRSEIDDLLSIFAQALPKLHYLKV